MTPLVFIGYVLSPARAMAGLPPPSVAVDVNGDFVGDHRRLMGNVKMVPQLQLQGVFVGAELEGDFRLPRAKMTVVVISRHRRAQRGQLRHVDQQMMTAGVGLVDIRRRYTHALDTESYGHRILQQGAVGWRDKLQLRAIRR